MLHREMSGERMFRVDVRGSLRRFTIL